MDPAFIFDLANKAVLMAWFCLIVLPFWRYTQTIAFGVIIPVLAITYASLLIKLSLGSDGFDPSAFSSLEGVMSLSQSPMATLLGWVHFLAFDLFVGAWIVRDARANSVHHLLILVPLFLTLMAGPFGLILYLVMRQIQLRRAIAEPTPRTANLANKGA